jgi:hypothetical protein
MSKYNNEESISIQQIILNLTKKITDLSLQIVNEDSRVEHIKAYKDSILSLSDVLVPFYDDVMNEAYTKYEEEFDSLIKNTCEKGLVKNTNKWKSGTRKLHRQLFRELNLLLNRNDYLKSAVYGEDRDEIAEEDE